MRKRNVMVCVGKGGKEGGDREGWTFDRSKDGRGDGAIIIKRERKTGIKVDFDPF